MGEANFYYFTCLNRVAVRFLNSTVLCRKSRKVNQIKTLNHGSTTNARSSRRYRRQNFATWETHPSSFGSNLSRFNVFGGRDTHVRHYQPDRSTRRVRMHYRPEASAHRMRRARGHYTFADGGLLDFVGFEVSYAEFGVGRRTFAALG